MNLSEMRAVVRRDLKDEDEDNYRWTNDELDRHIAHVTRELSEAIPCEQKATKATASGSREIDISSLSDRIMVQAVEYPVDNFPKRFQRFTLWGDTLTLLGEEVPDGSNTYITGACGYAAVEWAIYAINRVNVGGTMAPREFLTWGNEKLRFFKSELKRLGRRNRVRVRSMYKPCYPVVSKATDYGP